MGERKKDRISYQYGNVQVDLTMVGKPSAQTKNTYELEVEAVRVHEVWLKELRLGPQQGSFKTLVEELILTTRALSRFC